jgi:hypothetical protein
MCWERASLTLPGRSAGLWQVAQIPPGRLLIIMRKSQKFPKLKTLKLMRGRKTPSLKGTKKFRRGYLGQLGESTNLAMVKGNFPIESENIR